MKLNPIGDRVESLDLVAPEPTGALGSHARPSFVRQRALKIGRSRLLKNFSYQADEKRIKRAA